jgi:hypothetical protein
MPKPSKYSADIKITSMEEDDDWNKMSMDRAETRRHFEHNEIECKEGKKYQAIVDNENKLRGMGEEPNRNGRTYRRVR